MAKYVITLVGGIGNIIQTTPFMLWLRSQGHEVYGKADKNSYSLESCELVSCAYDELIQDGEMIEGAIDKGNLLCSPFKSAVKKMPEWEAWFRWHKFEVPETVETRTNKDSDFSLGFDMVLAPTGKPSWPMKRWPYWQELIYKLPGCAVVGLEGDGGNLDGDFHDYRGKLSLGQAASFFANSKIVIAEEGGMSHLSCAQGTRTLILFGGTDPLKNLPPHNGIVVKTNKLFDCQPCQLKGLLHRTGKGQNTTYHGCHPNDKIDGYSRCMHSLNLNNVLGLL